MCLARRVEDTMLEAAFWGFAGGFALLGDAAPNLIAAIQAFAAGANLTMVADTMMPEGFEHGGKTVGLVTVLGFAIAFFLSTLE
jgi:ZIP family zinc transporter